MSVEYNFALNFPLLHRPQQKQALHSAPPKYLYHSKGFRRQSNRPTRVSKVTHQNILSARHQSPSPENNRHRATP